MSMKLNRGVTHYGDCEEIKQKFHSQRMKHIFRDMTQRKQRFLETEISEALLSKLFKSQLRKHRPQGDK